MTSSKKYSIQVEKVKSSWTASIIRKLSSTRTSISKSQGKFKTKTEATAWAEEALAEFTKTQASSNIRKTEQRSSALKSRQERSERRAAKTAEAKAQKALDEANALEADASSDTTIEEDLQGSTEK
jgi:hypothetical protein